MLEEVLSKKRCCVMGSVVLSSRKFDVEQRQRKGRGQKELLNGGECGSELVWREATHPWFSEGLA